MAAENPEEMEQKDVANEQQESAEPVAETPAPEVDSESGAEPVAGSGEETPPESGPDTAASSESGDDAESDSVLSESESAADAPDLEKLKKIVEGAVFAATKPMTVDHLGALFGEDERPSREDFRAVLAALTEEYADRGVMLKEVSSGFRFQVREDVGQWVSRLWEEKPARYSRALLETLALIAYRQPITRGEIEEIRGVSTSSNIMKTLQERDWIRVVGHRDVPGRPAMYATTRQFLDHFNLKNIDELPSLAEIRDLDEINRELDLGSDAPPKPETTESEGESNDATEGEELEAATGDEAETESQDATEAVGVEENSESTVEDSTEDKAEDSAEDNVVEDSVVEESGSDDQPAVDAELDSENDQQTEVESKETSYTS